VRDCEGVKSLEWKTSVVDDESLFSGLSQRIDSLEHTDIPEEAQTRGFGCLGSAAMFRDRK
jgi:hypothetical protein